jgi:O-antigen/teichoic acid export membrane protein
MATYGAAVFVLLVAGTTAVARDVILLMLTPDYLPALPVLPLVATAFGLQGLYQLTSIGLNLTSRTELYSIATITAAGVSLAAGAMLIPRFGVVGAAATVLVSYATQASLAFVLAQRVYPVRYEAGRLARLVLAGVAASAAALWLVPPMAPLAGFLARGTVTVVVYLACLLITGFLRGTERAFLIEMWMRVRSGRARVEAASRAD